jgi:hypothetical protein
MLCVLSPPAFITYRMKLPVIAPILARHPLLPALIKAHIDSNQRNLYLPFLLQLLFDPSPCSARKERNESRYLGNSIAPEADISIDCAALPSD